MIVRHSRPAASRHPLAGLVIAGLLAAVCRADEEPPTQTAEHIEALLRSSDPAVQQRGLADVRSFALDGPLGGGGAGDRAWRSWEYLDSKWLEPLLTLKQYDLVRQVAANGMTYRLREDDVGQTDAMQYCVVRALLAGGDSARALSAAKCYYNVCRLEHTDRAIDLMAQALAAARGVGEARRFRMQQAVASDPPGVAAARSDFGPGVLDSVTLDGVIPDGVDQLDPALRPYLDAAARGSLALMAGRVDDAMGHFEQALERAENADEQDGAFESLAKTVRDAAGNVGPANDFVLATRQGVATQMLTALPDFAPKMAANVPLGPVHHWVTPIDTYAPPHEPGPLTPPAVEPGGDALPPEPQSYARSLTTAGPELAAWLKAWEAALVAGRDASEAEVKTLGRLLAASKLTTRQAYDLARGMVYVVHVKDDPYDALDPACAEATRALVDRVEGELHGIGADDPHGNPDVEVLRGLNWVWGVGDHPTTERVYRLLAAHNAVDSKRSRESTYLAAEAVCDDGRYKEAEAMLVELDRRNVAIGDVSPEDTAETHWAIVVNQCSDGRYAEAGPMLDDLIQHNDAFYAADALRWAAMSAARRGDARKAKDLADEWIRVARPSSSKATEVLAFINIPAKSN